MNKLNPVSVALMIGIVIFGIIALGGLVVGCEEGLEASANDDPTFHMLYGGPDPQIQAEHQRNGAIGMGVFLVSGGLCVLGLRLLDKQG